MTTRSLPVASGMDYFKKQAKTLLKAFRSGDAEAQMRIRALFADETAPGLQNVQLVIAREYGFASWTKLKAHVAGKKHGTKPEDDLADRFLSLACVSYFSAVAADPARYDEAGQLLDANPALAQKSIYTAIAAGNVGAVKAFLERDPSLVRSRGGVYGWTPLLYAAYARVPGRSSFEAANVLVSYGADPNDFYMDDGQYRFTALTGVFGEGEAGKARQPRHPDCTAFATLLLEAGASPNDGQALYNRMFEPDNDCLELLLRHGLSAKDRNNWLVRENGSLVENTQTVFDYQLAYALEKGFSERVRLLVEHGADVNRPVRGRSPFEWALLGNNNSLADFLASRGARIIPARPEDLLYAQIMDLSRPFDAGGTDLTLDDISILHDAHPAMMQEAAGSGGIEAVRRMLALGLDPNRIASGRTPLHEAALHGDISMAQLLIAHGADPAIRDPHHHAPPIGWAEYNGQADMVHWLKEQSLDIFAAAAYGQTGQLAKLLDADPSLLETRFGDFRRHGKPSPDLDWLTPLGFAIMRKRHESIQFLLERGSSTSVRDVSGRSLRDLARERGDSNLLDLFVTGSSDARVI